ncbi:hypothetical protein Rsub_07040 [Raphidocelis subcapitata]|uniref:Protein kinase domain-containing protein n=1 Tax=Raphidocelis subcapitata TaxID=307507 RepID=A0A2V0P3S2_9CHLO|nr:hypothetical protein Rsub_07040 [Raphidocelis subcapitata]|eukprot:GBF94506.1 hypothetical protein Rsub_07040 [Raphidocelis subcapitata]
MSFFSSISKFVGGGPALNYNVDEVPYPQAWGCWTHHPATSREDGSPASVFKLSVADPNDRKLAAARNGVRRLKMLRHPNILTYKDSLELPERGGVTLYLVTEAVKPLAKALEELALSGQHRDEYLATGILHMTNAVSFLNNDCKMIHGNVCMAAIVVNDTLDWKLHGFDLLSEAALTGDPALQHASWMVAQQYKCAEVARGDWGAVSQGPSWAVDAWGLGCTIQEVFSGEPLRAVEQLRNTQPIPPALLEDYQKLLSSTPARRLNPAQVAESKFLNNKLVKVAAFMENISVKDSAEKDAFFKRLPSLLPAIPAAVAARKVLPLLANALEFGGAPASAVGSLLQIGKPLPAEEFQRRVVPSLARLFASSDRALRRNLLEAVDVWGPHVTQSVLEERIFPQLQSGFSDENAYIRELTLKATLSIAPTLKQATLTGNVLRHLNRLQMDPEPSIRANTTVLLGNIADLLGDAYCKKVLLNAFGRALKDPFPPARVAALRALAATQRHYAPEEAACRALPAVAPLTVDAIGEVRSAALACLEAFGKLLRDHDSKLTAAAAAAAAAGGGAGAGAAPQGSALASAAGGMLGWAMSSLVGGAPTASAPTPAGGGGSGGGGGATAGRIQGIGSGSAPPAAAGGYGGGSSGGGGGFGASPAAAVAPAAAAAAAGAWEGDDDDFEGMEEELQARSRLSGLSMSRAGGPAGSSGRPSGGAAAAAPAVPRTTGGHLLPPNQRPRAGSSGGGGAGSGGGGGAAAASSGWDDLEDGDGWESLGSAAPSAAPAAAAGGGGAAAGAGSGVRPRPLGARPAGAAGAGRGAAGGRGAMKLGASKLGAQKLDDFDF